MNAIETFAEELAGVVFSGQTREVILREVSHRTRCVLDAHQENKGAKVVLPDDSPLLQHNSEEPCEGRTDGLRTGRCPRTGHSCLGAVINNPGHFMAGHMIGEAIREALNGKLERRGFTLRLIQVLTEPPDDVVIEHSPK